MTNPEPKPASVPAPANADAEHAFHRYTSNAIPWYVRLIWVMFYVFAAYYIVTYLFPAMQDQFGPPRTPRPDIRQTK